MGPFEGGHEVDADVDELVDTGGFVGVAPLAGVAGEVQAHGAGGLHRSCGGHGLLGVDVVGRAQHGDAAPAGRERIGRLGR